MANDESSGTPEEELIEKVCTILLDQLRGTAFVNIQLA